MKKFICILLSLLLVCSMVGCNKETPVTSEQSGIGTTTAQKPTDLTTDAPSVPTQGEETYLYKIPTKEIYFDYPVTLTYFKQTCTQLLFTSKDALVGICCNRNEPFTGALENVAEFLLPYFLDDASTTSQCTLFHATFSLESAENVTVNGLESSKFVAVVTGEEGWDCHVYGYSFLIDGLPCAVIGIVSTEEQAADMIAEYDALVDKIAGTTRTKP